MIELGRAFVAVVPPPDALDAIDAVLRDVDVPSALRWVPREQWHLTLRFLGRVRDLDAVVAGLDAAFASGVPWVSRVRLGGGGTFPSMRHAAAVWVGLASGAESVVALARVLGSGGGEDPVPGFVGEEPDRRTFRPHLTLARPRGEVDVRGLVAALDAAPPGPEWTPSAAVLFESLPARDGVTHVARARFTLAG